MKKEKRCRSFARIFQDSIILSVIFNGLEKTRFLLTHGFFARVFTAYSEEERLLESGLFSSNSRRRERRRDFTVGLKRRIARAFEDSLAVRWFERMCSAVLYRRTRTYGVFLLSMGTSGTLVYIFREFILEDITAWHGIWLFPLGAVKSYKKPCSRL